MALPLHFSSAPAPESVHSLSARQGLGAPSPIVFPAAGACTFVAPAVTVLQPQPAVPGSVRLAPAQGHACGLAAASPSPLLAPLPQQAPGTALALAQVPAPVLALGQAPSSTLVPPGSCAVVAGETVTMPGQPSRLTAGMTTPEDIAAQRQEYSHSIDEQQRRGEAVLSQQAAQQREHLRMQAEQQKVVALGRWDQHLRAQELLAEREYQQQLAALRAAAAEQRAALEERASQLIMDYHARRTQQEVNRRSYQQQVRQWEAEQSQFQRGLQNMDLSRSTKDQLRLAQSLPQGVAL
uniref:Uncharacterized protein n=1 Tax=Alexandrium monilatum TaxID=311494 RepID=A0A7S4V3P2_9DINO